MFDKLKESLMKRIQENSVESELTYKDIDGVEHTEKVYLKRGKSKIFGDWHQEYIPIKTDGTNKWDLPNAIFGGKRNLRRLIFYLILAGLVFLAFKEMSSNYEALANLPCVQNCLNAIGYN